MDLRRWVWLVLGCLATSAAIAGQDLEAVRKRTQELVDSVRSGYTLDAVLPDAQKGNVRMQDALGGMYQYGVNVPVDYHAARDWYTRAAQAGFAPSQLALALLYLNDSAGMRDDRLAGQWMAKAAAGHLAEAQYRLSLLYDDGVGVTKDPATARQFLMEAARQDYSPACTRLGYRYLAGEGLPRNAARAMDWLRRGNRGTGGSLARYELARMYEGGLGVTRDLVLAYVLSGWSMRPDLWYPKVAESARAMHAKLDRVLTPAQRELVASIEADNRRLGMLGAVDDYIYAQSGTIFAGSDDPTVPRPSMDLVISPQGQFSFNHQSGDANFLRIEMNVEHFDSDRPTIRIVAPSNVSDPRVVAAVALAHDEARKSVLNVVDGKP